MLLKEYGKAKARVLRPLGYEPPRELDPERNGEYRLMEWLSTRPENLNYDSIIDVGANIGAWTRAALQRFSPPVTNRIICVEPVPHFAEAVRAQFREDQRVVCREVALSDSSGFSEITIIGGGARFTGNKPYTSSENSEKAVAVHRVGFQKGDELVTTDGCKPYFIKIDCDGNDLNVLRGFSRTLLEIRPVVQFEYCDFWAVEGSRLRDACGFLYGKGYTTFKLFPDRLRRFRFNPLFETFGYQNVVAVPSEWPSFADKNIPLRPHSATLAVA